MIVNPVWVPVFIPVVIERAGIQRIFAIVDAFIDGCRPGDAFERRAWFVRKLRAVVVVIGDIERIRVKGWILAPGKDLPGGDFHDGAPDADRPECVFRHLERIFQGLLNGDIQSCIDIIAIDGSLGIFFHAGQYIAVLICLIRAIAIGSGEVGVQVELCSHLADDGSVFIRLRKADQIRGKLAERINPLDGIREFDARQVQCFDFILHGFGEISARRSEFGLIDVLIQVIQARIVIDLQNLRKLFCRSFLVLNIADRIADRRTAGIKDADDVVGAAVLGNHGAVRSIDIAAHGFGDLGAQIIRISISRKIRAGAEVFFLDSNEKNIGCEQNHHSQCQQKYASHRPISAVFFHSSVSAVTLLRDRNDVVLVQGQSVFLGNRGNTILAVKGIHFYRNGLILSFQRRDLRFELLALSAEAVVERAQK